MEWSSDFVDWHNITLGGSHPKITVSIMAHIKQFLEGKLCWAIVPVSVATGIKKESDLINVVKPDFELPCREVSIITLPDDRKNTSIDIFYDCLKQTVSKYML